MNEIARHFSPGTVITASSTASDTTGKIPFGRFGGGSVMSGASYAALTGNAPAAPSLSPSSSGAVLGASYFVHLPYARDDEKDHRQLAAAVAEVIRRIVKLEARV